MSLSATVRCSSKLKHHNHACSLQNEVESLRLKTTDYEMIVAQHAAGFTLLVIQDTSNREEGGEEEDGEEKKE